MRPSARGLSRSFVANCETRFFPSIMPMPRRPVVFAHRGASRAARENTIEAFERARDAGADGVELDARRTADGVLVVHHDPQVDGAGLIAEAPFAALHAAAPHVPMLVDALTACAGLVVNVEVKCLPWEPDADTDRSVLRHVVDVVREHAPDAIVSSFDLGAVDASLAYAPEIATALLTMGQDVSAASILTVEHGHACLNVDRVAALAASARDVADAHARGIRVNVWTVDDPDEMRALAEKGVDGVITNVPDVARATLG